jgi:hypothetical protein
MMGEFFPVVYIMMKCKRPKYFLYNNKRKWGKCFDKFYKELGFNVVFTNKLPKNRYFIANYNTWDTKWNYKDKIKCSEVIKFLKHKALNKYGQMNVSTNNELIIQYRVRNQDLENHFSTQYQTDIKYGPAKRHFLNMNQLHTVLENTKYLHHDNMPILKQISYYINANRILLEHGAGMVFILFMKEKSNVIELITPDKQANKKCGAVQGAMRLCAFKKSKLSRVVIEDRTNVLDHTEEIKNFV